MISSDEEMLIFKVVADCPVGQVLAKPLFLMQGKNKILFYRKQVINKSTMVIFGLIQHVILRYSRQNKDMMRWKIIDRPHMQNIMYSTRYSIVQELSNEQSTT